MVTCHFLHHYISGSNQPRWCSRRTRVLSILTTRQSSISSHTEPSGDSHEQVVRCPWRRHSDSVQECDDFGCWLNHDRTLDLLAKFGPHTKLCWKVCSGSEDEVWTSVTCTFDAEFGILIILCAMSTSFCLRGFASVESFCKALPPSTRYISVFSAAA